MTGTTPLAPIIAKARAQEFPSTSSLSRTEVPDEKCRTGSMWHTILCLTQFSHHTVGTVHLKFSSHYRPGRAAVFSYNGIRKKMAGLGNFVVATWYVGAEAVAPNFGDDDCELSLASTLPH